MAKEILIAGSNRADQGEFKRIFGATDYNLVFSESGEHALLRLKLFRPDLIIAGPPAKEKSGLDVCKAVKGNPEFKDIPIILLSNVYGEISDGERVSADGIITRPFREDEILNMVDRLIEEKEKGMGVKKEEILEKEREQKSMGEMGKTAPLKKEEGFLSDETGEAGEEDIVELVDVVEEPELKMSIDEFIAPKKEAPSTEITPLESWEKLMEEEKPAEERFKLGVDEKELEVKGLRLPLDEKAVANKEVSEKELLEKIELEEILQKVEELAPSIEKEWPTELSKEAPEMEISPPAVEEPPKKYEGLAEFEAALKRGIGVEPMGEEVSPVYVEKPREEPKKEVRVEVGPAETPTEIVLEEGLKEVGEEVLEVEEEEEALKVLEGKELKALQEEALKELEEEEMPGSLFEEIEEEEARGVEGVKEEGIELLEEAEGPEVEKEEIRILEEPEEETLELLEEEVEAPEILKEEMRAFEKPEEERIEIFEEVIAPVVRREEVTPPSLAVERHVEEVILKGAREMLEGFLTKLVPEMTQSIMNLTIERIERMVREIVPKIAEKMIQEEIKRLRKGERE